MATYLDWDETYEFVREVFKAYGVPEEDAIICTDVLLDADKRGMDTHGLTRLKPIYIDRIKDNIQSPVTEWEIIKETPTTAVIDAHDGMGQVASYHSMRIAKIGRASCRERVKVRGGAGVVQKKSSERETARM